MTLPLPFAAPATLPSPPQSGTRLAANRAAGEVRRREVAARRPAKWFAVCFVVEGSVHIVDVYPDVVSACRAMRSLPITYAAVCCDRGLMMAYRVPLPWSKARVEEIASAWRALRCGG